MAVLAPAADALRIVTNLTNYRQQLGATQSKFQMIRRRFHPTRRVPGGHEHDGGFLVPHNVLNANDPVQWASAAFLQRQRHRKHALFYKPSKVQVLGAWAWYPNPLTNLRFVTVWRLKPVGYTSSASEFRVYSCHLKASTGFETDRYNEAVGIRDSMNAVPPGTHTILMGDFNIYHGAEAAFQRLLASLPDNDGRLYDPFGLSGIDWDNVAAYAYVHTQCPCLNNCPTGFGFAGGGMDSRFDMFLPTYKMNKRNRARAPLDLHPDRERCAALQQGPQRRAGNP